LFLKAALWRLRRCALQFPDERAIFAIADAESNHAVFARAAEAATRSGGNVFIRGVVAGYFQHAEALGATILRRSAQLSTLA
jgi:hypothetical protein